jgi:hypothetical protein
VHWCDEGVVVWRRGGGGVMVIDWNGAIGLINDIMGISVWLKWGNIVRLVLVLVK